MTGGRGCFDGLSTAIAIDTLSPTIAIASSTPMLKAGQTATIAFTLGEAATDFTVDDVTVTGGVLAGFMGSGMSYSATFTPTANSTSAGTISVAAASFTDSFGNDNTAGALAHPIVIDTVTPTISIASSTAALRAGQTATITFTLSEPSTSFTVADVTATGGTLSGFTGSGTSYSTTFTPNVGFTGSGTVSVADGAFTDAAGNANAAGALSPPLAVDTILPTITAFGSSTADGSYPIGGTVAISATLSEPVQSGGSLQVKLNTGATVVLTAITQGTTLTGSYLIVPGQATTDIDVAAIQLAPATPLLDLAGNQLTSTLLPAAPNRLKDAKDIAIAGGISATARGFSSAATNVADKKATVLSIPITFNTPVTGVKITSFRLFLNGRGVSLTGATVTGSGSSYTLKLPTGRTSLKGIYSLQILSTGIRATANQAPMTTVSTIYWGNGASVTPRSLAFAGIA